MDNFVGVIRKRGSTRSKCGYTDYVSLSLPVHFIFNSSPMRFTVLSLQFIFLAILSQSNDLCSPVLFDCFECLFAVVGECIIGTSDDCVCNGGKRACTGSFLLYNGHSGSGSCNSSRSVDGFIGKPSFARMVTNKCFVFCPNKCHIFPNWGVN